MDIIIQSLGFKAGPELEGYVKEKLEKITHMTDNVVRADVTLYIGAESDNENKFCEIRLEIPGYDHFVKKNAETFEMPIVDVVNTLQKLVRQKKEKQIDSRRPNA